MTNYLKNEKLISMDFHFLSVQTVFFFFDKFDQAIFGGTETSNIFKYIFVSTKHVVFRLTNSVFCIKRRGST